MKQVTQTKANTIWLHLDVESKNNNQLTPPKKTKTNSYKQNVCVRVCSSINSLWPQGLYQAPTSMDFPDKNTGVGCHFFLQGSSQPKGWTRVFCISCNGRQILYYFTTWEAPETEQTVGYQRQRIGGGWNGGRGLKCTDLQ